MSGGIDYTAVLADLERKRDELDRAIAAIRSFVGHPAPNHPAPNGGGTKTTATTPPQELRSDAFFNMKAPDAVKAYLGIVKRPQTVREIADGLQAGGFLTSAKAFYNNLYTVIVRLREAGEVVQLPQKRWGLAEWYPARPKQKDVGKNEPTSAAAGSDTAGEEGAEVGVSEETAA